MQLDFWFFFHLNRDPASLLRVVDSCIAARRIVEDGRMLCFVKGYGELSMENIMQVCREFRRVVEEGGGGGDVQGW